MYAGPNGPGPSYGGPGGPGLIGPGMNGPMYGGGPGYGGEFAGPAYGGSVYGGPAYGPGNGAIVPLVGPPVGGFAGGGIVGPPIGLAPAAAPVGGVLGGWVTGYYVGGDLDGRGNLAGLDYDIGGVNFGLTRQIDPTLLVGGFVGFANNSVDVDQYDLGSYDVDTFQFGAYFRKLCGNFYFIGAATAGLDEYDVNRNVDFKDFVQRPASANFNGNTASVFGELGYTKAIGCSCSHFIQPFASLQYTRVVRGAFHESGKFQKDRFNDYYDETTGFNKAHKFANKGDEFGSNLTVSETEDDFLRTRVGVRAFRRLRNCDCTFRVLPEFRAYWAHEEYDPSSYIVRMNDSHDCPFVVAGLEGVSDAAVIGGGLTFAHCCGLSLYGNTDVFLADRQTATAVSLGTQLTW
ncbi:autotransporter outer membrane beta-barrel domain-containing protein, partial [Alienimonas chondri]|uniref:Autotransporter domain-containing protein n=1 Tax=Alienimonas chondri TaxID=2681879 RepID=A0ABX1VGC1_9PLAN